MLDNKRQSENIAVFDGPSDYEASHLFALVMKVEVKFILQ